MLCWYFSCDEIPFFERKQFCESIVDDDSVNHRLLKTLTLYCYQKNAKGSLRYLFFASTFRFLFCLNDRQVVIDRNTFRL